MVVFFFFSQYRFMALIFYSSEKFSIPRHMEEDLHVCPNTHDLPPQIFTSFHS